MNSEGTAREQRERSVRKGAFLTLSTSRTESELRENGQRSAMSSTPDNLRIVQRSAMEPGKAGRLWTAQPKNSTPSPWFGWNWVAFWVELGGVLGGIGWRGSLQIIVFE